MHVDYIKGKSRNLEHFKYLSGKRLSPGSKDKKKFEVIHGLTVQVVSRRGLPYGSKRQRKGYERRCKREVRRRFRSEYGFLGGGIGELIIAAFISTMIGMIMQYLIPKIIDWLEGELSDLKSGDQQSELKTLSTIAFEIDLEKHKR